MKYLLQLERRGEYVSEHTTLEEAQEAVKAHGFKDVKWQDHPRGQKQTFESVFKNIDKEYAHLPYPVLVAYPKDGSELWIWRDPEGQPA